jgi:hypothetical protein
MAITSICGILKNGQDASCTAPVRKFYQQAVFINISDIEKNSIQISVPDNNPDPENPICPYRVNFSLKEGKTGIRFVGSESGSTYKGYFEKTVSDLGYVQYKHNAQILIVGSNEQAKCILDSLGKGKFVAVYQLYDGTVEVYGITNGLSAGDYTYDIQEGGGGTAIVLSSMENAPENYIPLVYKSNVVGGENADFDSNFANFPLPV